MGLVSEEERHLRLNPIQRAFRRNTTQIFHLYTEAPLLTCISIHFRRVCFAIGYKDHSRSLGRVDIDGARDTEDLWERSATSGHHNYTKKDDLLRIDVRAVLVHVRVILEECTLRNVVRGRDGITTVPGLHDVGGLAILASETQAEDLYSIQSQSWHRCECSPRQVGGCRSSRR